MQLVHQIILMFVWQFVVSSSEDKREELKSKEFDERKRQNFETFCPGICFASLVNDAIRIIETNN